MEKEKNETESERKSDTSLKGTVIAFIILLILAIAAFLWIDCQVKCNTIREKNFEAPRRESEN